MTESQEQEVLEPEVLECDASEASDASTSCNVAEEVQVELEDTQCSVAAESAEPAEDPLAQALEAVALWKDKHLRLQAEWDTYRRRMTEQRAEEKLRAAEKLVESLLPVIDDFERTIAYAEEHGETGLLSGVEAVHTKLISVLKSDGVEVIDPAGEPFDALEAQAVATVEDAEQFDETVAQVFQKGYKLGNKVIRPAMVTVTCGGPRRELEESE